MTFCEKNLVNYEVICFCSYIIIKEMRDIMLTKEEVLHVAHLARIEITEEELLKYQKSLKILFDEIDKIRDLNDFDEEKMVSPCENSFDLQRKSCEVDSKDLLLNVPKKKGNFVEVPVMVNE